MIATFILIAALGTILILVLDSINTIKRGM